MWTNLCWFASCEGFVVICVQLLLGFKFQEAEYIVELRTPATPVGVGGGKERGGFYLNLRTWHAEGRRPILGPYWPILRLCWPMLAHLGGYVGRSWGLCWPILRLCWPILRPMWTHVDPSGDPSSEIPPRTPKNVKTWKPQHPEGFSERS